MKLGFEVGANVPTAVVAVHLLGAAVFFGVAAVNATDGSIAGIAVNALIGVLLLVLGVAAARITARR
jgi:hypothetical protein